MYNCTFSDNVANRSAGAIFWNGHNGTVEYSKFYRNRALGIANASDVHGVITYGGDGGALMWSGALGDVAYCNFVNNSAVKRGGAVFLQGSDIENCENTEFRLSYFANNVAGTNGGAIDWSEGSHNGLVDTVVFYNNTARRNGGAIFWNGHNGTVKNSRFINNRATGESLQFDMNLTMDNVLVLSDLPSTTPTASDLNKLYVLNKSSTDSDVWYQSWVAVNDGGYKWVMLDEIKINGSASSPTDWAIDQFFGGDGGSILWSGDVGDIWHCNFTESNSARRGGGAYMTGSDNVTYIDCQFINCTSGTNGGGVDWLAGANYGKIYDCVFIDNRAARSAGAIYYDGDYGEMRNVIIINSFAYGGSLKVSRDGRVKYAGWDSSHWDTNTTGGDAGAIMFTGNHEYVYNITFIDNVATGRGGAVFLQDNHNVTFELCNFTNNRALGTANNTHDGHDLSKPLNKALSGHGGAIAFDSGATEGVIKNCYFDSNIASNNGGAISFDSDSANGLVQYSLFINNTAKRSGGALYWDGYNGTVLYSNFINNRATGESLQYDMSLTMDNVIVLSDLPSVTPTASNLNKLYVLNKSSTDSDFWYQSWVAVNDGGYKWVMLDEIKINGSASSPTDWAIDQFFGGDGGSILWSGDVGDIWHCNFTESNSARRGGGAYMTGSDNVTYIDCQFINCTSGTNGGGVDWLAGANYGKIYDCVFIDNRAARSAGAIYYDGDYGEMRNVIIINSFAYGGSLKVSRDGRVKYAGWDSSHWDTNTTGGDAGAIMITGDHEYLYNITFFNTTAQGRGGAVFLQDNTNITFDSCRFLGCEALGIANNTWDDYKSEYDHKGYNYKLTGHGGAIAFDIGATDALIKNSEFIYNYARRDGGAINIALNSFNATIENCNFTNNSCGDDGGAINWEGNLGFVKYSKFYNNTAVAFADPVTGASSSRGGTVFIKGDNVTIDGSSINISTVLHNKGDLDRTDGGAMVITGNNTHILNSKFDTCWSPYVAGAIRVIGNYSLIDNCTFENCNATKDGGALYIEGLYCNLSNTIFENNFVGDDGGAIYWEGDLGTMYNINCTNNGCKDLGYSTPNGGTLSVIGNNITITKSNLKQSSAKVSGGAIFITGNYINITDTSFEKCSVYKNITTVPGKSYVNGGGALYLFGNHTSILNCTFYDCEGREGGAVYIQGNDVIIDKSSTNSTNAVTGGAIYIYGLRANILNSTFDLSYASTSGGAIYSTGSYSNVLDSNFTNNLAEYDGGAIYWQGTSKFENSKYNVVDGCIFIGNTAYAFSGQDTTRGGGAIFWSQKGSNGAVKNSKFINNSVQTNHKADGGAILWDQSYHGIIDNCTFDGNYITSLMINNNKLYIQGGALFLRAANNYTISNCIFENCWSDKEGGAIYLSTRNPGTGATNPNGVRVINVTFINNTAKGLGPVSSDNTLGGGAVFIKECINAFFENVTFINNTASQGGAFSLQPNDDSIKFNNCTFIGNKAENDGGAIWVGKFTLNIYDSIFYKNSAGNRGGAIYNSGNFAYRNLTFINNSAYQGGAIAWFKDGAKTIENLVFINNSAYQGGAMYLPSLVKSSSNNVGKNNFTNNSAYCGGAIYVGVGNVYIYNNNFTKNSAIFGGAIYQPNALFSISITNSVFNENNGNYGGALLLGATSNSDSSNKIVQYCNFTDNKANIHGGAIYVNGSYQRILNCIFNENNASGNGGSIYVVKNLYSTTIQDSTFTNSRAGNGGAIYKNDSSTATLYIKNDTFINNTAVYNGGAVLYCMGGEKYRDFNDFDNRADVSPTTSRTTYSTIGITSSLFRDNEDYKLLITTITLAESPTIVVYLANPLDPDENSIYFIVNVSDSNSTPVGSPIIVNKDNYELHYNPTNHMVYVSVEDLRINGTYSLSIGFNDDNYMYKEFSINETAKGIAMGEFELLQNTIENEIKIQSSNTNDTYYITLNRDYTFTRDYYNSRLDTKCINLTNIDRPIVIDGNGSLINAKGFSRIFNITACNVTLINFRFANGNASGNFSDGVNKGGAIFWAGEFGNLVDSNLYNNYANRGGAIYYNSSARNCSISNSIFLNNTADSFGGAIDCNSFALGLYNNIFESNIANVGGAVCGEINAKSGSGFNNTFKSNIALTNGSAIALVGAKNISINSYYFYDNVAGISGGAIHVNQGSENCEILNCIFDNNTVTNLGGYGGAIGWNSKKGLILNSNFTRNHAANGGAMYVGGNCNEINIIQSNFSENNATVKGGAINVESSSIIINASKFFDNCAGDGGALYVGGQSNVNNIYSSIFKGNKAYGGFGGAINWEMASGMILDSALTGNCADYGGALYIGGFTVETIVKYCNFTDNHAKYSGGAIDCNSSKLYLSESRFDANWAQFGAALCREINAHGGNGSNNVFINNHAFVSGAALGWMGSLNITIVNYTFINNSADVSGGAIYASPTCGNCSIIDSYFESNYVTNETLGVDSFTWTAWDGTSMEFLTSLTYDLALVNRTIMNSTKTTYYYAYGDNFHERLGIGGAANILGSDAEIINSQFIKNYAKLGGGIYVGATGGKTFIENSKFISNVAYQNGGAINLYASSVHIDYGEFIDNSAINGSALYVGGVGTNNKVHSSIFKGNNATDYGAGIFWRASAGEISNSKFESNEAVYGGGIYLNGVSANTNITNSTFKFNKAVKCGGAIESNAANIGIYNITFDSNYAGEYGAALCRESGSTNGHGKNNTFINNHAGISGAALAWLSVKNMDISHYYFINNTAGESGGAIYVSKNSDNCTINYCYFERNRISNTLEGYGGAIAVIGDGSNIKNSKFINNFAYGGGAIYTGINSGHTNILNVTFKDNSATANGGAIEILGLAVVLNHTNFSSNTAGKLGGAVFVNSTENSNEILYSVFDNNKAGDCGGAINWFKYPGDVFFSNFTNNQANYGGAIYLDGISSNDKIFNVIFENNTATKNGGAIDCNASYICLNNTLFINNYAGEYGAALCREIGATNGFGENTTFINNRAGISGAALAWLGVNGMDIHNYTFINNTAVKSGGAIFVRADSSNATVRNCKFDNNYVTDIRDSHGGAIDWHGPNGYIFNSTFANSFALNGGSIFITSENMIIDESVFVTSRALGEGGIIALCANNTRITKSNFTYSVGLENGGAISAHNSNNATIYECFFDSNVGAGYIDASDVSYGEGGAIFWENSNNLNFTNLIIIDTESHGKGAVSLTNCNNSLLYNVTIKGAITIRNGGAVSWINSVNATIDSCTFKDSASAYDGGSIYFDNIHNGLILNSSFNNTKALYGNGGAIFVNGNVTLDNNTFTNFDAYEDYAGGIFVYGGNVTISNSKFNGTESIWVNKFAIAYVIKNYITGRYPNKNIVYLEEPYDSRYNKYDYSVWNDGTLYLDDNNFDFIIFNNGTIKTPTTSVILGNITWNETWNTTFTFWVNITDDNDNTIISVDSFDTWNNHYPDLHYNMSYNKFATRLILQGDFIIYGSDYGLENNVVKTGAINVKLPTKLTISVDDSNKENIHFSVKVEVPVASNWTFDTSKLKIKINGELVGNVSYSIFGDKWLYVYANFTQNQLPVGTYTLSAYYEGDLYHLASGNESAFAMFLHEIVISVQANNILYGQTLIVDVRSNATNAVHGRIIIYVDGRQVSLPLQLNPDGSYEYRLPNENYTSFFEPGEHILTVTFHNSTYYSTKSNSTYFNVSKLNTTMNVTATNITLGENEIIEVNVNESAEGYLAVRIGNEIYVAIINNGTALFNISGLSAGNYDAVVTFPGDNHFNMMSSNVSFVVNPTSKYTFDVKVDNIKYGQNATVRVLVPTNAGGNVTIYVDGKRIGTVEVLNGTASLSNITGLAAGSHSVNVTYSGDSTYIKRDLNNTIFNVTATDNWAINITVTAQKYGDNTEFNVTLPQTMSNVTLRIDGHNYTVNLTDGKGRLVLNNITAGLQEVTAIYAGDINYTAKSVSKQFEIGQLTPIIKLTQVNGDVIANVSGNPTGSVTFYIRGESYTLNLTEEGIAVLRNNLTYGINNIFVTYNGDKNHTIAFNSTTFDINKYNSTVKVNVSAIDVGDVAIINITAPDDIEGTVIVNIDGANYTVNIINGTGQLKISRLSNGTYTINATYMENDKYLSSSNATQLIVSKVTSFVKVIAQPIAVGDDEVILFKLPTDATGYITVIVNNKQYQIAVYGGNATLTIQGLHKGDYRVNASYSGDDKYLAYENNTQTFKVIQHSVEMNVIDEGNRTIFIYLHENATGSVRVEIGGEIYDAIITNGTATITLTRNLPGTYNALVNFTSDGDYENQTAIAVVHIPKYASPISVNVSNIKVGDTDFINVTIPVGATGSVTIEINGKAYTTSNIVDGVARFEIGNLTYGNKTLVVKYSGDNHYEANSTSGNLTVSKHISTISVNVSSIAVGEIAIINVTAPGDISGHAIVNVDGVNYTAIITNGSGSVKVSKLTSGTYTINVTYVENTKYLSNTNHTVLEVYKLNTTITVQYQNTTEDKNAIFNVDLLNDVTGNVTIEIDNKKYVVGILSGNAQIIVAGLTSGEYDFKVVYAGDDKYNPNETETFKIKISKTSGGFEAINVIDCGNRTVIVEVPNNATGTVSIKVANETYIANVSGGKAVLYLENVTPGVYNVTVVYSGDMTYPVVIVENMVNIPKSSTPIIIEVNNTFVGNMTKVIITAPGDINNNITIEIDGLVFSKAIGSDGKAIFELPSLVAGEKTITATYDGDTNYLANSTTYKFMVSKVNAPLYVTVDNSTSGKIVVEVSLPDDATGYVIVNVAGVGYGINITNAQKSVTIPITKTSLYNISVSYLGDEKYMSNSTTASFKAAGEYSGVAIDVNNTIAGNDVVVRVVVPDDATGNITVKIGNTTKVVNVTGGENIINVSDVSKGEYDVVVTYSGDDKYDSKTIVKEIEIFSSIVNKDHLIRSINSPYDYEAQFFDKSGNVLTNTNVQFEVNGKTYTAKTDSEGIARLTGANLGLGSHVVTVVNPATGEKTIANVTIVAAITGNKDIVMDFIDGTYYVVRAIGDDGNPVGAGEIVGFRINGVDYNGVTDENGYARLKINLNPTTVTITSRYSGYKVSNKITIKQTLKLVKNTITIKKSTKSFKIKATLKWSNGKAIAGKKIAFKLNGKVYSAKVNSKGIAQVTIKSSDIKKLKAGKTYKYYAKYVTNYVYGKVKVKK